ncbi:MAG: 3-dehydroquinate synthase [Bacteroidales bacterium]|nr:3-dehydroquinate synthase [Bacteroidales bacterium]
MMIVKRGAVSHISDWVPTDRKVMVVTDSGVPFQYAQAVLSCCPKGYCHVFEQGEENKTLDTVRHILEDLLEKGFTRTDAVIAVGGGVVGDVAGFAASCYMRGIDFYNVPTTLLSQVDSSIGGKTGVDFGGVKNVVGAFYMPKAVVIDPDCLSTLDPRLLHEGLAEAIKMAATSDASLFSYIEEEGPLEPRLDRIITGALAIKEAVVEADPKESGLRRVLNFGHTVGHAIEAASAAQSQNPLFHGESVAAGMLYMCSDTVRARLEPLLRRYNLPVSDPFDTDTLLSFIGHDKKKQGDTITAVFVDQIGSFEFRNMDMDQMRQCIQNHKNATL